MTFALVADDFRQTARRAPALFYFGWDDIRQQYRRTVLGPIWLTFGTVAWIFGMAMVLAALFNQPLSAFLPHTTIGMFVWTFLALSLTDGCNVFVNATGLIHSMRLPLLFHVGRALLRHIFLYAHYLMVCLVVMLLLGHPPGWLALLAIPGIAIQIATSFGFILTMGLTNARYRDLLPITVVICQLMPMVTPIAWNRDMLKKFTWIADWNPFYHLIEIVRAPMLGALPTLLDYEVSLGLMAFVVCYGLWRYQRVRYQLIFWI